MIYIESEKRRSPVAADGTTVLRLSQEIPRAGTGLEAGMSRDRRSQSDSPPVRVPGGTESSAVGKVTLTQSLVEPAPAPERGEPGAPATADASPVQRKLEPGAREPSASAGASRLSYDLASLFGRAPREPAVPIQRRASSPSEPAAVSRIAAQGVAGAGAALPHLSQIQASFGHHDVSGVRAHQGPPAAAAARELGADAYATGNAVAFSRAPDLHTAAHEAAHVVQQRGGVQLKGGIDQPGDAYEQHADAVADAVVAGRSAEALLDRQASGTGDTHAVQRKELPEDAKALESQASLKNTDVEIPALEGALLSTRLEAVKKGLLSKASFDASLALSMAMTQLQPAVAAKGAVDVGVQVQAALAAQQLFTALQRETADGFQVTSTMGPGAEGGITEQNPYTEERRVTTTFLIWSSTRESAGWLQQLPGLIHQGKWSDAFDGYRRLMNGLDLWVADQLRKTGKGTHDEGLGNAHQYHAQLRTGLEQIADKHATRVPALFHPDAATVAKDKAAGRPAIDSVPMNVYFWKDAADGKFHLYDLTTPSRPHEQTLDGQPTAAMMNTFFEEVARYPEGEVRYTLPGGAGGVAPTTGKTKWYEWVGYAGLAVAAVGLAFVTAGASVPATVCFAAGALAGGISAGGHLADTVHLGTATTATVVLDVAQVAASFASFGAMSLTVKAGSAAAALAGSRYFVPLLGAAAAADTVQVVALTSVTFTELDKIQRGAGTPEDKQRATTVLLTQLVVTGGLTVMSVQGARNARAMAGRPLEVVDQNGVNMLRLAGETTPEPVAASKTAAADTQSPSSSTAPKPTEHADHGTATDTHGPNPAAHTEASGPLAGSHEAERWLADLEHSLNPAEKAKLARMKAGKTPQQVRDMLGDDLNAARERVRAEVRLEQDRAAVAAQSKERVAEMRKQIADRGLMDDPEIRAIVDGTTMQNRSERLSMLRDKLVAKLLRPETERAHPGAEVLEGVKIYEKLPEANLTEWRAKHPGTRADGLTDRPDGLYMQRGEIDIMVVERLPSGKAKVIAREEIKTGVGDTHAKALTQLDDQTGLLRDGAAGKKVIRLELGRRDITSEIDLGSDASASKSTRGPAGKKFDESLGVSANDLEALCKELLANKTAAAKGAP